MSGLHLEQRVSKTRGSAKAVTSRRCTRHEAGCRTKTCTRPRPPCTHTYVVKFIHPEYLRRHLTRGSLSFEGCTQRRVPGSQKDVYPRAKCTKTPRELAQRISSGRSKRDMLRPSATKWEAGRGRKCKVLAFVLSGRMRSALHPTNWNPFRRDTKIRKYLYPPRDYIFVVLTAALWRTSLKKKKITVLSLIRRYYGLSWHKRFCYVYLSIFMLRL